ncbi:MAG: nucleotide exchange factor GrpE [Gammaproteobacteria bacterium]|nr:nucleotide exchange factor GrpE [Gammaproteobacteria bacterium]TVQ43487.1 MAG: nucleotide exchange factor GrpE [Gammaproteobacteria bacterium]
MNEPNDPRRDAGDETASGGGVDEYAETQVLEPGSHAGAVTTAELETALAEAESRAQAQREQALRLAAEIDNLRKRSAREVENARKFGAERLAGELLAVVDSLEMGLEAARGEGAGGALVEGQEATLKLLSNVLEKAGVRPLDPQGEAFDPQFHEAMSMVPTPDAEPGSVITVVQKGYLLHERLLRPARVLVAAEMPG